MRKKLRSRRGETLVETLAAILIVTLASIVLLTMTLAAVRVNRMAESSDEAFWQEVQAVETQVPIDAESLENVVITVDNSPPVEYTYGVQKYGASVGDGLVSYALKKDGGQGGTP